MISKQRKKRTTRKSGLFSKKNSLFIAAGVIAASVGVYLLAGDQIKNLLKGNKPEEEEEEQKKPQLPPAQGGGGGGGGQQSTPEPAGLDIDKKLKKGSTGEEVKRLQFIINGIAGLRNTTSYKTPAGYTVKFPISADGSFGSDSQAGAYFIAPAFKDQGFITLDQARKRLAFIAGYYDKPFPSSLVSTKNYKEYQTSYKAGEIDGAKNKSFNLPNVGLNITNIPSIFN
jgi:hypothetical protein